MLRFASVLITINKNLSQITFTDEKRYIHDEVFQPNIVLHDTENNQYYKYHSNKEFTLLRRKPTARAKKTIIPCTIQNLGKLPVIHHLTFEKL